jgi:methylphosphotriester-DNA--protein-cysteine methyltransferase
MIRHIEINDRELRARIKQNEIPFAGNAKLKIYGKLNCKSGKRMKKENRVFFHSEKEAADNGFRPCGHCMKQAYGKYKRMILAITNDSSRCTFVKLLRPAIVRITQVLRPGNVC